MRRALKNNSEVAHVWASQSQDSGYSGNMFFEGDSIYSYGHHYLAAKIYGDFVLVNSYRYSSSTGGHLNEICSAISHKKHLSVTSPSNPKKSLRDMHASLGGEYFEFLSRRSGRFTAWREWGACWREFEKSVEEFNEACVYFKCKALRINLTDLHEELWREKFYTLKAKEDLRTSPEMIEKREKARLKRDAAKIEKEQKELDAAIIEFRNGGIRKPILRNLPTQLLRINEDRVETSLGAYVSVDEARDMLERIQNKKARKGKKVGNYQFTQVVDGIAIIGCHRIAISEAINLFQSKSPALSLIQGGQS